MQKTSLQNQIKPKISVAIAGSGISGLCLAQSLLHSGFDVHVYERDGDPMHGSKDMP